MNRPLPVTLPEGYVEFYKDLETWQNAKQIMLQKALHWEKHELETLLSQHNHLPLLKIKGLGLDFAAYAELFLDLLEHLLRTRPEISDTIDKLKAAAGTIDYETAVNKVIENDFDYFWDQGQQLQVPAELLLFVLDHALRPFLRAYALPYQEELGEDANVFWDSATLCPICGSKAHISRLRAVDGRRFMFCDRCFSEWEVKYLMCVHCGNDTPGTIKYVSVEQDEAYQIYTCDECKGYIKTYDERQGGKVTDLFIANIETIYLDLLAQEKGYTSHDAE